MYKQNAPTYGLPQHLHSLQASLDFAGACLNEVLLRKSGKINEYPLVSTQRYNIHPPTEMFSFLDHF